MVSFSDPDGLMGTGGSGGNPVSVPPSWYGRRAGSVSVVKQGPYYTLRLIYWEYPTIDCTSLFFGLESAGGGDPCLSGTKNSIMDQAFALDFKYC